MDYTVFNGGDYPIDNAVVLVSDLTTDLQTLLDQHQGSACQPVIGTLAPKAEHRESLPVLLHEEPAFSERLGMCFLLFTDTWDQTWARGPGLLEARPVPPLTC